MAFLTEDEISKLDQPILAKRLKIVIGINSLVSTVHAAYGNHINLFYRLGRSYSDIDFILVNPPRMSIDTMRNLTARVALEQNADYVWFIDDDVIIPVDPPYSVLRKLIAANVDAVSADVIIRGYPFEHMLFKHPENDPDGLVTIKDLPPPDSPERGFLKLDALGFSCTLIKTEVFRKMSRPFFVTGINNTEDIYFFVRLRERCPETTIAADTSVICGHILWNEIISSDNKELYKKYFEEQYKPEKKPESEEGGGGDRGTTYLKIVRGTLESRKQ